VPATRSNKRRVQILVGLLLTLGVANLPLSTWGGRLKVFGPLLAREGLWELTIGVLLFSMCFASSDDLCRQSDFAGLACGIFCPPSLLVSSWLLGSW
jgi:hypothetical protein